MRNDLEGGMPSQQAPLPSLSRYAESQRRGRSPWTVRQRAQNSKPPWGETGAKSAAPANSPPEKAAGHGVADEEFGVLGVRGPEEEQEAAVGIEEGEPGGGLGGEEVEGEARRGGGEGLEDGRRCVAKHCGARLIVVGLWKCPTRMGRAAEEEEVLRKRRVRRSPAMVGAAEVGQLRSSKGGGFGQRSGVLLQWWTAAVRCGALATGRQPVWMAAVVDFLASYSFTGSMLTLAVYAPIPKVKVNFQWLKNLVQSTSSINRFRLNSDGLENNLL